MKYLLMTWMVLLAGCAPTLREVPYTWQVYPPTTHVDILDSRPEDKAFVEIAEITARADRDGVAAIVDRAKESGADAVLFGPPYHYGDVAILFAGGNIGGHLAGPISTVPMTRIRARLIKYLP
ncbi:hypothetical protein [Methylocaldum sp.]|uniref:hypothetical protein n=1 Tax=Methylocaldum sp. TaxID=1969727 RepID=UPI002D3D4896|nr:hypothetical protein [Methylocaldum sp.]HYE34474.1 hypothetical protein [Methylocaldum sp.]